MPKDLPKWQTVYYYFNTWKEEGRWDLILEDLTKKNRIKVGKKTNPTLLVGDSQAVKNTDTTDKETKGFCFYKCTNGIKRHLLIDVLDNVIFVHCTPANVSGDQGLLEMFTKNINYFKEKPVNTKKITILLDNGYHKEKLETEMRKIYPKILSKIRIQITPKPKKDKDNPGFKQVS